MILSIVVPLYNEELIIKKNLEKIYNYFLDKFIFEIIVVNDGSIDDSLNIVEKMNLKNITIINNQYNCGKGNAIKSGVLISRGDVVLITDADLSASIDQFITLYNKYLEGFDIVIASRSKKDSKVLQRQSIQRVIAGKLFNFFIKNILNLNFKDTQCGFKLFNGIAIRKLIKYSIINRFCIDVEILYLGKKLDLMIHEIGIQWKDDGISTVRLFRDSINMFFDLLRIKFNNYKL